MGLDEPGFHSPPVEEDVEHVELKSKGKQHREIYLKDKVLLMSHLKITKSEQNDNEPEKKKTNAMENTCHTALFLVFFLCLTPVLESIQILINPLTICQMYMK